MRNPERHDDLPAIENPEDVAVLYSWANLHGAKYRDFSASRREVRAQLRHRAAEQVREIELQAKIEAETAAESAETVALEAERAAAERHEYVAEASRLEALRQAEDAARIASAERMEAARRAEAAVLADALAHKEEREIADAHASARRQSDRYADSERHRRPVEAFPQTSRVPGQISDPYTPLPQRAARLVPPSSDPVPPPAVHLEPVHLQPVHMVPEPLRQARPEPRPAMANPEDDRDLSAPLPAEPPSHRLYDGNTPPAPNRGFRARGYHPDDAAGVRCIARGPEFDDAARPPMRSVQPPPAAPRALNVARTERSSSDLSREVWTSSDTLSTSSSDDLYAAPRQSSPDGLPERNWAAAPAPRSTGIVSPFSQQPLPSARPPQQSPAPRYVDRAGDNGPSVPSQPREHERASAEPRPYRPALTEDLGRREPVPVDPRFRPRAADPSPVAQPASPAWLYEPAERDTVAPSAEAPRPLQTSVSDTLQQSRERVASRWFALKGVFEQPGSAVDATPAPQQETRTPVLAVFSLAGGVGKTSLVATLGRSLSSIGEKVLLTDTTTHGLLPFYFGASELRQGAVRTFSPPTGSTDAPIYLVSYDADARRNDASFEEALAQEITASGRGTHRVLLDLSSASSWVIRRLARSNPTIIVPVAPDMNSVISLHTVERLFADVTNADGLPVQVFFLLNHFDASLPLHLDVREVLRRQLGDRLLPFAIRRSPVVSEALAEGMTVVDYAPEDPVAEDFFHVANWLRTLAAPATAGFRNVRWSER